MLSVSELLQGYLETRGDVIDAAPGGVCVGPADNAMQQAGCVVLTDQGTFGREIYTATERLRVSCRCLAPTTELAERIARSVVDACHRKTRVVMRQPSDGQDYLVHWIEVAGGYSIHRDSDVTWEGLLFVELWVGTCPIGG